jgi:hypothetical protein
MWEFLQHALAEPESMGSDVMAVRLAGAFALGAIAAGIHAVTCTRPGKGIDRALLATLILLSLLIALITMIIGNNSARAFSLVGTLAIVRFRTDVEDTRDTSFVIFAVACGMCAGAGHIIGPLACAPLVFAVAWFYRPKAASAAAEQPGTLVLRLAAGRNPEDRVGAILDRYAVSPRLTGLATARGGTAFDATYTVRLPASPERVFTLIDELSRVEGVQGVELKGD